MKKIETTIFYVRSEDDLDLLYKIHYASLQNEMAKDKNFKKKDFTIGTAHMIAKDMNDIRNFGKRLERTAIKPQIRLSYLEMLEKLFPSANFEENKFGLNYINDEIKKSSSELKTLNNILAGIFHVIYTNKYELNDEQLLIVYSVWNVIKQLVGNTKIKFKENMQKITYYMKDIGYSSKYDLNIDSLTNHLLDKILSSSIKDDFKEFYSEAHSKDDYMIKLIKEREKEGENNA